MGFGRKSEADDGGDGLKVPTAAEFRAVLSGAGGPPAPRQKFVPDRDEEIDLGGVDPTPPADYSLSAIPDPIADDDDLGFLGQTPEVAAPRRLNLRPVLAGLTVLLLGGGLGVGAYYLSAVDVGSLIGLMDVADPNHPGPKLTLQMPTRDQATSPATLLRPPGSEDPPAAAAAVPPPEPAKLPPQPQPQVSPPAPTGPAAAQAPAAPQVAAAPPLPEIPPVPRFREAGTMPAYATLPELSGEKPVPLGPAPVPELLRQTRQGTLPVTARDGRQSRQVYARPYVGPPGAPRIAVVITDLGLDSRATDAAIDRLPGTVSLAFSPYAPSLDKWVRRARDAGHEVLLMLPSESQGFPARDPGPMGLLSGLSAEDNMTRLETLLARTTSYIGLVSINSRFAATEQMGSVLASLKERGLLYLGSGGQGGPLPAMRTISAVIDQDMFRDAIDGRLARVTAQAKQDGTALIALSARPVSLDRLLAWMATLGDSGVQIAPASAVVKEPGAS